MSRIQQYEKRYETIDDKTERNYSFIKIFNCGERFLVHKIGGQRWSRRLFSSSIVFLGHIQSRVVYFLMNIHVLPRTIYLTRVTAQTINAFFGLTRILLARWIRTESTATNWRWSILVRQWKTGKTNETQADVLRDQALEDELLLSDLLDDANIFFLISVCRSLIKLHGLW